MACLFISHDLELVREVADHIAVMQHGKIVENKSKAALFKTPSTPTQKPYWPADPTFMCLKRLATVNDFLENEALDAAEFTRKTNVSQSR